jgi:hypothetical protein
MPQAGPSKIFHMSGLKYCYILLATISFLSAPSFLKAQLKLPYWETGISSAAAVGNHAPFWIVSNRQGKFLPEKFAGSVMMGLFSEDDKGRIIDYDYGLEIYARHGNKGDLWLHQAFAGITLYDFLRLQLGMKEEIVGSAEPSLSSGSVIWSSNARPMPKVSIGIPDYVPLPYTAGYVEMKGLLAHGWFEEERFVRDVWLHHKNAYIRFGGPFPVSFHYGFNHYAQWGGQSPRFEEPFPSDLRSFFRVFLNRSGSDEDPGTPEGWIINRFGNSIGSRNYGLDLNLPAFSAGLYQQDIFEDGSGMRKQNFPDGLWGAWIRFPEGNRILQAVVYEFLHTTNQSGPYHDIDGDTLGGNDNYFNHGHYQSGWTRFKYTIGTPLITSPVFNDPLTRQIINNRVIAHHLGFEGGLTANLSYRNLVTFSRNFGTYSRPFNKRREQLSWMLELNATSLFLNFDAGITFAADIGEMYGNNFGLFLTLRQSGAFR